MVPTESAVVPIFLILPYIENVQIMFHVKHKIAIVHVDILESRPDWCFKAPRDLLDQVNRCEVHIIHHLVTIVQKHVVGVRSG